MMDMAAVGALASTYATKTSAAVPLEAPAAELVERFAATQINAPAALVAQGNPAAPLSADEQGVAAMVAGTSDTPGGRMLRTMQSMSDQYQNAFARIENFVATKDFGRTGNLLILQAELAKVSFQMDVMSRGVSKATGLIDELTKLQ